MGGTRPAGRARGAAGAGHASNQDNPAAFTAAVAAFLDRVLPARAPEPRPEAPARGWLSGLLAIAGVLACSGVDWSELNMTSSRYLAGNVLIFGSILGSAFYNTYSKRLLQRFSDLARIPSRSA